MPTTPALGIHYPAASDAPDGAGAIYQLATDVEALIQGSWIAYNPGMPGVVGASITGEYRRFAGYVHFTGNANFGGAGGINSVVKITLPVTRRGGVVSGRALAIDQNAGLYELVPVLETATSAILYYQPAGQAGLAPVTSAGPFGTVNSGDQIAWDFWYAVD